MGDCDDVVLLAEVVMELLSMLMIHDHINGVGNGGASGAGGAGGASGIGGVRSAGGSSSKCGSSCSSCRGNCNDGCGRARRD